MKTNAINRSLQQFQQGLKKDFDAFVREHQSNQMERIEQTVEEQLPNARTVINQAPGRMLVDVVFDDAPQTEQQASSSLETAEQSFEPGSEPSFLSLLKRGFNQG